MALTPHFKSELSSGSGCERANYLTEKFASHRGCKQNQVRGKSREGSLYLITPTLKQTRPETPPLPLQFPLRSLFLLLHVRCDKSALRCEDWQASTSCRQVAYMAKHMLFPNPPNPHLIRMFSPIPRHCPPSIPQLRPLPASDTCGQKVTRRLIFHRPCTVGRVIQSEFPQSLYIYMKSSHSASVTSPALVFESPPSPLPTFNTHTHLQQQQERERRERKEKLHHSWALRPTPSQTSECVSESEVSPFSFLPFFLLSPSVIPKWMLSDVSVWLRDCAVREFKLE